MKGILDAGHPHSPGLGGDPGFYGPHGKLCFPVLVSGQSWDPVGSSLGSSAWVQSGVTDPVERPYFIAFSQCSVMIPVPRVRFPVLVNNGQC